MPTKPSLLCRTFLFTLPCRAVLLAALSGLGTLAAALEPPASPEVAAAMKPYLERYKLAGVVGIVADSEVDPENEARSQTTKGVAGCGRNLKPNRHEMKAKRIRHDPEFKARVALEALQGVKTIQQIANDFDIEPAQVSEWKKIMSEGATTVFESVHGRREAEAFERERNQLHSKIGQQAVELDFLTKMSRRLGL